MIDPNTEKLLSLAAVPAILPHRRGGKRPHISCIYRWTIRGCRGVVLESLQVGGTRCTSREALARFFERLTDPGRRDAQPNLRSQAQRDRAVLAAERELEREGA